MFEIFDLTCVDMVQCGGMVTSVLGPILGAVTSIFGGGNKEPNMPAAPASPDTSAVDAKARADEERRRRIGAQQNSTAANGGQGTTGQAATQTPTLG